MVREYWDEMDYHQIYPNIYVNSKDDPPTIWLNHRPKVGIDGLESICIPYFQHEKTPLESKIIIETRNKLKIWTLNDNRMDWIINFPKCIVDYLPVGFHDVEGWTGDLIVLLDGNPGMLFLYKSGSRNAKGPFNLDEKIGRLSRFVWKSDKLYISHTGITYSHLLPVNDILVLIGYELRAINYQTIKYIYPGGGKNE